MPTPSRKYFGPCPEHLEHYHACRHCKALREREQSHARPAEQRAPIYPGLHWPAPEITA